MTISIDGTPKVQYIETDSNPNLNGDGAEIPIFIGRTGNESPASGIQKFTSYEACAKTVANGGIGTDTTNNPLLAVLKDFFEESRKVNSSDITVPYVYVIDLGVANISDSSAAWTNAFELAKSKREVTMECIVGFKKADTTAKIISVWKDAVTSVENDSKNGNPRIVYSTVLDATDSDLKNYTNNTETIFIQNKRFGLIEPNLWGKTLAKIVTTPYYEEPGFTDFRTIEPGTFDKRTPEEEKQLQNAGIIFIKDELAGKEVHPKIDLAVSSAFALPPSQRPNDVLLHSRRNVDQLVRDIFVTLYNQIKRNETETNISFCQTDADVIIEDKIEAGYMKEGTKINVQRVEGDPFKLEADGVALPVNSTLFIDFKMYIDLSVEGSE